MEKAYIRGSALVCSLGDDIGTIIKRIKNKECAAAELPISVASLSYTRPYYLIPEKDEERRTDLKRYFYNLLFSTVSRAIEDSGLTADETAHSALFFGSTSIDIPIFEMTYKKQAMSGSKMLSNESPGYGKIASMVAEKFDVGGPCYTFTTACTSSANCLLYAASMIRTGHIERAIVIGYDLFNELGFYGFESMKLIEPNGYKPFDKNRIGIIMGEGCGVVVLDRKPKHGRSFRLLGGSNACDTFNVTTHNIRGDDIAHVIRDAVRNSGLSSSDIDAVKAHATGSPVNDITEYNGMKAAFGDALPPFTGLKPYIGHTVGACGTIELIIVVESAERGFFPATPGFGEIDEEINARPITEHLSMNKGNYMLNFFGFGGNCTSLVISNRE